MEWQNWANVMFLLLPTFLFVPFGWSIMRGWLGKDNWWLGTILFVWPGTILFVFGLFPLYLMANITEDTPGLQDDRNHTRQSESRDSLLQQREYLEARLWEMKTECQAP